MIKSRAKYGLAFWVNIALAPVFLGVGLAIIPSLFSVLLIGFAPLCVLLTFANLASRLTVRESEVEWTNGLGRQRTTIPLDATRVFSVHDVMDSSPLGLRRRYRTLLLHDADGSPDSLVIDLRPDRFTEQQAWASVLFEKVERGELGASGEARRLLTAMRGVTPKKVG